ncbi:MAG: hypothetical protein JNM68_12120, partial [Dinghuibacter sp.]|nr:hypothetical protein [Dinghuibacter sp.]
MNQSTGQSAPQALSDSKLHVGYAFNLKEFLFKHIKYLPLFLLGALASYGIAKLRIRYSTNLYKSAGTMLIKDDQENNTENKAVQDLFMVKPSSNIANEIEMLKSRSIMKRVVQALDLQTSYYTKGKVMAQYIYKTPPFVLVMANPADSSASFTIKLRFINDNQFELTDLAKTFNFGQNIQMGATSFRIEKNPPHYHSLAGEKFIVTRQGLESAAASYAGRLRVARLNDFTRVLAISMEGFNPDLCADVINKLMEIYQNANVEDRRMVSKFTKEFIDSRVNTIEGELGNIEGTTQDFREKNESINLDAQSQIYLNNINSSQERLNSEAVRLGITNELLRHFRDARNRDAYAPVGTLNENNIQNLLLQFNTLQIERKRLRDSIETEEGFNYKSKTQMLEKVKNSIIEGLSNIQKASSLTMDDIEKTIRDNTGKLSQVPYLQNQLNRYDRNQKIKEELYLYLKKKGEEAGITSASTLPNSKIIDPALPGGIVAPVKKKIYTFSLFLGLLIPLAIAYFFEMLNDKIRYRDDIEKHTNAPIVAEVGHSDNKQTALVVTGKTRKVIAEQFRMLRTNLQYIVGSKDKTTLLVTSSFSGEGKSFISTNLAA